MSGVGHARMEVLSLYANFLRRSKGLPVTERSSAITRIKQTFREHKNEQNPQEIEKYIKDANSRLRVLQMRVPNIKPATGSAHFTFIKGKEVSERVQRDSVFYKDQRVDPEDIRRHESLLRRQYYLDRPPPEVFEKKW